MAELVSVGSLACAACSSESMPAIEVCCLVADEAFIWPAPGSSLGRACPDAVSTAPSGDSGDRDMRCAWFAAASEGVGVSVGDNSAASIEVGVALLLADDDDGDEGFGGD